MRTHSFLRLGAFLAISLAVCCLNGTCSGRLDLAGSSQSEQDFQLDIYVTDALTGQPMSGVPIEVYSDGSRVGRAVTDVSDHTRFTLPSGQYTIKAKFSVLGLFEVDALVTTVNLTQPTVLKVLVHILLATMATYGIIGLVVAVPLYQAAKYAFLMKKPELRSVYTSPQVRSVPLKEVNRRFMAGCQGWGLCRGGMAPAVAHSGTYESPQITSVSLKEKQVRFKGGCQEWGMCRGGQAPGITQDGIV